MTVEGWLDVGQQVQEPLEQVPYRLTFPTMRWVAWNPVLLMPVVSPGTVFEGLVPEMTNQRASHPFPAVAVVAVAVVAVAARGVHEVEIPRFVRLDGCSHRLATYSAEYLFRHCELGLCASE